MGKAALFFVSGFIMLGAFYALGTQRGLASTEQQLAEHQHQVLARNAALAGYQKARQALTEHFGTTAIAPGTFEGAAYQVVLEPNGSVVKITSTGTSTTADGKPVQHKIVAEIKRETISPMVDTAPPFMQYALLVEDDLTLKGNILTDVYISGNMRSALNANIHTNGTLSLSGNAATVRGFGTYVTGVSGNANHLKRAFNPYHNPTGNLGYGPAPRVEIPVYDAATYLSRVSVDRTSHSSVTLSGTLDLGGTREDPYVWHVKGSLTATGGVTIKGYTLFLVDGQVNLGGNVVAGETGWDGADESSVAFYSAGDVTLTGNGTIYGQINTSGNMKMSGTPSIYGSLTTGGTFTMSGTPNIYYRTASPALTTIYNEPEVRYSLLSYSEW